MQNYVNKKEMNDLYERKIVNQEKSKLLWGKDWSEIMMNGMKERQTMGLIVFDANTEMNY